MGIQTENDNLYSINFTDAQRQRFFAKDKEDIDQILCKLYEDYMRQIFDGRRYRWRFRMDDGGKVAQSRSYKYLGTNVYLMKEEVRKK